MRNGILIGSALLSVAGVLVYRWTRKPEQVSVVTEAIEHGDEEEHEEEVGEALHNGPFVQDFVDIIEYYSSLNVSLQTDEVFIEPPNMSMIGVFAQELAVSGSLNAAADFSASYGELLGALEELEINQRDIIETTLVRILDRCRQLEKVTDANKKEQKQLLQEATGLRKAVAEILQVYFEKEPEVAENFNMVCACFKEHGHMIKNITKEQTNKIEQMALEQRKTSNVH